MTRVYDRDQGKKKIRGDKVAGFGKTEIGTPLTFALRKDKKKKCRQKAGQKLRLVELNSDTEKTIAKLSYRQDFSNYLYQCILIVSYLLTRLVTHVSTA